LGKHGEKALQFVEKNNWNNIAIEFEDYLLNTLKQDEIKSTV